MKTLIDVTCVRCWFTTSFQAIDAEEAIAIQRASHVCADGVKPSFESPFRKRERVVLGPGERLANTEEPR